MPVRPGKSDPTERFEKIWQVVRRIPYGRVSTYGRVARLAGLPGRSRFVGLALRQTPVGLSLPWHRVINASGRISLPKFRGHYAEQKTRLIAEGILFRNEKVNLLRYGWPNV